MMANQTTAMRGGLNPTQSTKTLKISEFFGFDSASYSHVTLFMFFLFDIITSDVIYITSEVVTSRFDRTREKNTLAPTGDGTRGLELARQAS